MTTDTPVTFEQKAGHTYLIQTTARFRAVEIRGLPESAIEEIEASPAIRVTRLCPVCRCPASKHDAWGCQNSTSAVFDLPATRCRCAMPSIALIPKPGRQR